MGTVFEREGRRENREERRVSQVAYGMSHYCIAPPCSREFMVSHLDKFHN